MKVEWQVAENSTLQTKLRNQTAKKRRASATGANE
jgi:hypothetical protein